MSKNDIVFCLDCETRKLMNKYLKNTKDDLDFRVCDEGIQLVARNSGVLLITINAQVVQEKIYTHN